MNIFEFFAALTRLPIDLFQIEEHIRDQVQIDQIRHFPVSIDPAIFAGFLRVSKVTSLGQPSQVHADIVYSASLSFEMARVVRCKELLHILDSDAETAHARDEVSALIGHMRRFPLAMTTLPGVSDDLGFWLALSLLLPRDALHELRPLVASGQLSVETVADMAQLPADFVEFMLSSGWEQIVEMVGVKRSSMTLRPYLDARAAPKRGGAGTPEPS